MPSKVQIPTPGRPVVYSGIFVPHWEIAHIRIRVSRRRLPIFESVALSVGCLLFFFGFLETVAFLVLGGYVTVRFALPCYELWATRFPDGFVKSSSRERAFEYLLECGQHEIEFEGIVSERGRFGHIGSMNRQVEIVRVLKWIRRPA